MANRIHPTAIVGTGVELGDNNVIGPYTTILGPCQIGDNNWIASHVAIGGPAEVRGGEHPVAWDGEVAGAGVRIGSGTTIREFVTISQGTHEVTTVGDDAYLLTRSHVGHDCVLGAAVTLACTAQLGGHTIVGSWANIGMSTVVHQRSKVGPGAMVGMGSALRRDVAPFTITLGNPARTTGVNVVGLQRRGVPDELLDAVSAYVLGKGDLPAGLPDEVTSALTEWAKLQEV